MADPRIKLQKTSRARVALYRREQDAFSALFRGYGEALVDGRMSRDKFSNQMQRDLRRYYIRLALLGKDGRDLTGKDRQDLTAFLGQSYEDLSGFMDSVREQSRTDAQFVAQAESYGYGWGVFTRYNIPGAIADLLPALPGVDCLGQDRCGCGIEWSVQGGSIEVYWILNPSKIHCVLCSDFSAQWAPLVFDLPDEGDMSEEDWQELLDW